MKIVASCQLPVAGCRSRRAFTLLELLIAASIFAVLASALFMVFSSALRLRERAYETIEEEIPTTAVMEIMRRDLGGITIPSGTLAGPMLGVAERKGGKFNDYLEFYTTSGTVRDDLDQPWGEIQRVAYYLASPGTEQGGKQAGMELVREVQRNLLSDQEVDLEIQTLLAGVETLEFGYALQQTWLDEWDSELYPGVSPQGVRVHINFVQPEAIENKPLRRPLDLICEIAAQTSATSVTAALEGSATGNSTLTGTTMGGETQ